MLDPAVGALLAGCYALLFASAALQKLRDLPGFAAAVAAYRLLPAATGLAWLLPLAELLVAGGLLATASRAWAAPGGAVLLGLYAAAIAINLQRGRTELACGCGGPNERRPIAAWMVWRNLALALGLVALIVPWSRRSMQPTDVLTVAAGVATAAILYASLDRLLGQARLSRRLPQELS